MKPPADGESSGESQASRLMRMALDSYRFGCSDEGLPFAVPHNGANVALSLRGRGQLRASLATAYYRETGKAPSQNSLAEALAVIEGMANDNGRERLSLRVAAVDRGLVVDLGRPDGRVAVITPAGWAIEARSPCLFRRTEAVGELPLPVRGGALGDFRQLVNVPNEDWPVVVAFLVAALMPDLAHPILLLSGEQGAAKSTCAKLVVQLVDGSQG